MNKLKIFSQTIIKEKIMKNLYEKNLNELYSSSIENIETNLDKVVVSAIKTINTNQK